MSTCKESLQQFPEVSLRSPLGTFVNLLCMLFQTRRDDFARTDTINTGKPIWEGRCDTDGCIDTMEFYAGLAASLAGKSSFLLCPR